MIGFTIEIIPYNKRTNYCKIKCFCCFSGTTSYTSGAALSGQSTFASQTFSSLGLTTGSYTWTWGSGANTGSAVLTIGAVPEPSTYALAAIATGVMAAIARRRKARTA